MEAPIFLQLDNATGRVLINAAYVVMVTRVDDGQSDVQLSSGETIRVYNNIDKLVQALANTQRVIAAPIAHQSLPTGYPDPLRVKS
ncbi:hypothetical protein [Fibrella forsythiae]|uniref:Flagellar protein FlbD n=1 Tax=Fibrella forsythiae TaxID=2817061 RepID=A0ABS3JDL9_9BACT|nr:hypothetical protein [Fibrella forsythiae]MBO0946982.1 hypothetical protein [Fibrella forsythiae]